MPSYIEQSLSTGEQVEGVFKFHWFAWVPMAIWIILGLVTLGLTSIIGDRPQKVLGCGGWTGGEDPSLCSG